MVLKMMNMMQMKTEQMGLIQRIILIFHLRHAVVFLLSYVLSDSKISCDDDPRDNEGSDDDSSSAYDDDPSNERNPNVAATRPFSFTGNEHLVIQFVPSEAGGIVSHFDVHKVFVADDVLSHIVDETNRYAEQILERQSVTRKSRLSG